MGTEKVMQVTMWSVRRQDLNLRPRSTLEIHWVPLRFGSEISYLTYEACFRILEEVRSSAPVMIVYESNIARWRLHFHVFFLCLLRPCMCSKRSSGVTVIPLSRTPSGRSLFLGKKYYYRVPRSIPRCIQCRTTYDASYSKMNVA